MIHVPILRRGKPYRSLDVARIPHYKTGEAVAEVSQANPGLVRRDLLQQRAMRAPLDAQPIESLLAMCEKAATLFMTASLPIGDETQSPADYVAQTSSTTGLPHALVRNNMKKVEGVLSRVRQVLSGLTRGLDLSVLDLGHGRGGGHAVSFAPLADALGVVLPSNSPGVHALWAPTLALKTALILKPGSAEPWTPYRIVEAFLAAGAPPEAFGYYPTDHAGASEILRRTGRSMVFGDVATTRAYTGDPRVEIHGPGYSKVVLGADASDQFERYLDAIAASILDNGGRSCVNASSVWVCSRGRELAEALSDRFASIRPRAAEDPEASLAPFANPKVAQMISSTIDRDLQAGGATDVTAARRGPRLVTWDGATYLLPTTVHCESADHPLANREFLFPFASVVEVRPEALPAVLGPTLSAMVVTEDEALRQRILASPLISRLNLGPVPTHVVAWDQPHEGNLFEHLYVRRAFVSLASPLRRGVVSHAASE